MKAENTGGDALCTFTAVIADSPSTVGPTGLKCHNNSAKVRKTLFIAFLTILLWSPLPYGSDHFVFWSLLEGLTFLLFSAYLIALASNRISVSPALVRYWPAIFLFICIVGWSWLQSMPLGIASPAIAEIYREMGATPRLSVSAAASFDAFLKALCYSLLFALTLALTNTQERLRQLCVAIVVMAGIQACYGSFMVLSGLEYGFFMEKKFYRNMATGTFINRNHLAGYLELAGGLAIGLLVSGLRLGSQRGWRSNMRHFLQTLLSQKFLIRLVLAMIVIGVVMTRSRMGNTAFFTSMSGGGLIYLLVTRNRSRGALLLFGSLLIIDLLIVGNFFGIEKVAKRLEQTNVETEERADVIHDSIPIIQRFPITGTGGGTFVLVFPGYTQHSYSTLYDHAHNDYIEFAIEYGLIGSAPLAFIVIYSLWQALAAIVQRRQPLMRGVALGSAIAIVSLLIHSSVDFNLQIPANAALFCVTLALACISRMRLPER